MNPRMPQMTGRGWAYLGAILGSAVSIAANVADSYVPPPMLPPAGPPKPGRWWRHRQRPQRQREEPAGGRGVPAADHTVYLGRQRPSP